MVQKAVLMLDPLRRDEQLAFVRDRAQILLDSGDHLWVSLASDDLAERIAAQGIVVQVHEETDLIEVPSVVFSAIDGEPQIPPGLAAPAPAGNATAYHIVKFVAPPAAGWLQDVEHLGEMVEDAPYYASIFKLTAAAAAEVRALPFISFVGLYHPAYALHYALAGRTEPFSANNLNELAVSAELVLNTPSGGLQVGLFLDIATASAAPSITSAGATVINDNGATLIVNAPAARVLDLLRIPGVRIIQIQEPGSPDNQRAGLISGINQVRNLGAVDFLVNLDGAGEIAGVIDSGIDTGVIGTVHTDLRAQVLQLGTINPGGPLVDTSGHGTHVSGTIVGNGTNAPAPTAGSPNNTVPRGVAPNGRLIFNSTFVAPPGAGQNFNNYLAGFNTAYAGGARVQNNSWGLLNNSTWDNDSSQIDRFSFLRPDFTLLFTAGNQEGDRNNDGVLDMRTLRNTCLPKNVLAIGSCESQTSLDGDATNYRAASAVGIFQNAAFNASAGAATPFSQSDNANEVDLNSSRGRVLGAPAALQRIKPDLVAPGNNIMSTWSTAAPAFPAGSIHIPNTAPAAFYAVDSGTSMACPHVAGACMLVRQFYRTRFAELRRPLLIEQLIAFVDQPAIVPHSAGALAAWVHPDAAAGPNHLVAVRFTRELVQQNNIVRLITDVGGDPAYSLIRHGLNTVVLRRAAADQKLRLHLFDDSLTAVNAFGTAGVVTLAPASRTEADRRPTLMVRQDEVAVVWFETGTNNLRFQRFNPATGAPIDAASRTLGTGNGGSLHRYITAHDDRWAVVWTAASGANQQILCRQIDAAGAFLGAQPTALLSQPQGLREPVVIFDSVAGRYLVAYVTDSVHAGGDIHLLKVRPDGTVDGAAIPLIKLAAGQTVRRPRIATHTDPNVYIVLWEDSSQGTFDVYAAVIDISTTPVTVRRQVRISDTPNATAGFAALIDGAGIQAVWLSNDEINSDLLGVYTLRMTPNAVFQAQADPRTPLLQSGHYVANQMFTHDSSDLIQVALAWAGGDFYSLRVNPDLLSADVILDRTNPDGLLDTRMPPRTLLGGFGHDSLALHWTGNRLVACASDVVVTQVHLLDLDGLPVPTFLTTGAAQIRERSLQEISVQAAHRFVNGNLRIHVVWGRRDDTTTPARIRYMVLRDNGTAIVAARDLATGVGGTAHLGWFHALESEAPFHVIAAWHVVANGSFAIRLNRFQEDGTPQAGHATPIDLGAPAAGDSTNAVIAPRPVVFDPAFPTPAGVIAQVRRREFGIAWQFRPTGVVPSQILFSRLNRDGTVQATRNVAIVNNPLVDATNPQLVWHTDGYGVAWTQKTLAAGTRQLFFGIRDQAGAAVQLNPPPVPGGPAPAAVTVQDFAISSPTAEVLRYQMVWNGRVFRVCWTESESGHVRQMQRSISVARLAGFDRNNAVRTPTFDEPFQEPSSALVRSTLINGATNIQNTPLPNFPGVGLAHQPLQGYGWGRLNMRQALAPAPPVTFHVRDDASVAQGRTARYVFFVPPGTLLIRVTLCWTDPPGRNLVNNLSLVVTTPAFPVGGVRSYVGNRWQAAAGPLNNPQPSNPLAAPRPAAVPANTFQNVHSVEQVVITAPPALPSGDYIVEVVGTAVPDGPFQQFPGQPFSLVFVGSGNELRSVLPIPAGGPLPTY